MKGDPVKKRERLPMRSDSLPWLGGWQSQPTKFRNPFWAARSRLMRVQISAIGRFTGGP